MGDAHVHLFNGSDLPVGGFLRHVVLPQYLPNDPELWPALADIGDSIVKSLAVTVRQERAAGADAVEIAPDAYADAVAARIVDGGAGVAVRAPAAPSAEAALSYRALAAAIAPVRVQAPTVSRAEAVRELRTEIRNALEGEPVPGARPQAPAATPSAAVGACPDRPKQSISTRGEVLRTIRWGFLMLRSRARHLATYLRTIRSGDRRVDTILNLLVDYDRWLGSEPAEGSDHDAQIAFWSDFARATGTRPRLRTFAGYDPLRHAEQRLKGEPLWFDRLKSFYRSGRSGGDGPAIHGFKLYPPMGFRAARNAEATIPNERAGRIVRERWSSDPRLAGHSIGAELDSSLLDFFAFCADERAPILAHTYDSNRAFCGAGLDADPAYWRDILIQPRFRRLRVCFAHFSGATAFIEAVSAVQAGKPPAREVWAFGAMAELFDLSASGSADVFADIGYMEELLPANGGDAVGPAFFRALAWYCGRHDPKCERIMFGSDWIMFAREPRPQDYVQAIERGMDADSYWTPQRRKNFFGQNLERFLS